MGYSNVHELGAVPAVELSVLRHEMANVLNGLAGMTQLLKSSRLGPEQLHWLEAIEESTAQAHFLLREPLTADPDGAAAPGRPPRINGVRVLEQAVTAHTPAALKSRRRLLLELAPGLAPYWSVEACLLRQVLDNLVANALKFTDDGDILLSARGRNGAVVIRVEDHGPGVPVGDSERIFEPRRRGVATQAIPGQGLGLAVCRDLAGRMDGTLLCKNVPRGGARFELRLESARPRAASAMPSLSALSKLHCELALEPVLERIVTKLLKRMGVTVSFAGRAGSAGDRPLTIAIGQGEADETLSGQPILALRPVGRASGVRSVGLQPPLLESTLQRALMCQVLAWRWAVSGRSEAAG